MACLCLLATAAVFLLMYRSLFWLAVLLPLLPVAHACAWFTAGHARVQHRRQVIAAALVSITATWLSMALSHGPITSPIAGITVRAPFDPIVVAGFPLRHIYGHGGAGAPEWLPWPSALCLVINWSCWLAASWLVLRGRALRREHSQLALTLALGTTLYAIGYFAVYLD